MTMLASLALLANVVAIVIASIATYAACDIARAAHSRSINCLIAPSAFPSALPLMFYSLLLICF